METELRVIVFAGLPLTGKSTLAAALATRLGFSFLDIDQIRRFLFRNIADSEKDREGDIRQMRASWKSLYALTNQLLQAQESVILAATFSRGAYLQELFDVTDKYQACVKVICCWAPDEVIAGRVAQRIDSPSNIRTFEGYLRVKARFEKITAPNVLEVDTSDSIEDCLSRVTEFVS